MKKNFFFKTTNNPSRTNERADVPSDVVAPADGLHPVDGACVEPHQVTGSLDEAVNRHVCFIQVFQVGPPGTHQEVDVIPVEDKETAMKTQRKMT